MKIDLGCGASRREGYYRIDNNPVVQPDVLMNMQDYVVGLKENTVDDVIANHSLEFLDGWELYALMNHLHRAVKPTGILRIAVTSVILPGGAINPRAWTVPLLKTHFSPDTFKCFLGGSTLACRGVLPWDIVNTEHLPSGAYKVDMKPRK